LSILLVLALVCAPLGGCTAQRQYKVLSFFFDGVPDPNAKPVDHPSVLNTGPNDQPVNKKLAVVHQPYAAGNCRACHTSAPTAKPGDGTLAAASAAKDLKLVAFDSSLCVSCHKDKPGEFKVMHGPVAAAACMWCHEPHQSDNPALLKSGGPDLCCQCHDRQLLSKDQSGHQTETKACLDCHFGHGAPDSNLLRPKQSAQIAQQESQQQESRPVLGPELISANNTGTACGPRTARLTDAGAAP
jgi:predicted CXXCH cytochrome family protein